MTESNLNGSTSPEDTNSITAEKEMAMGLREFLETIPQNQRVLIGDLWQTKRSQHNHSLEIHVCTPEVLLHCPTAECGGSRFFRYSGGSTQLYDKDKVRLNTFITYRCSNCLKSSKLYSVSFELLPEGKDGSKSGYCTKFGEIPAFGPPTPTRLLRLFGKERENFLKGRRCESQGLGIGAFSYYRRIVENQKTAIFDEIIRVCESINASPELIEKLKNAREEVQFTKALSSSKDALPQSLLVNGHNPLVLLHSALSAGLHAQSDEDCLQIAHDIRVLMAEFAERLGQALNAEKELKESINRLMVRRSKNVTEKET